ncbi:hypothetical protein PABG_01355 [Paracoccidioides brasiliensis Pb03]|nr:hypothetical protein PABG_01355 [Paracoccidioides brasiliensis Pb03]
MDGDREPLGNEHEDADLDPTTNPYPQDEAQPHFDSQSLRVLEVVSEGNEDELRLLLDKGVDLRAKDDNGRTALHLAVINDYELLVELLLKAGSNTETADYNGSKPLHIAAELGNLTLVKLLLRFNADVESLNEETEYTAFYQALLNGHTDVAKVLLENRADIDTLTPCRSTPLFNAVIHGHLDIVEFLLENGASKCLRDDNGQTVEDLAIEGSPMMELLRSDRVLQGPSVENRKAKPQIEYTAPVLPDDQIDKLSCCRGFEGTVIDFFVEGTEQRIEKTVSVYDMLYGKGAEAIMNSAKEKRMDRQRSFRWYHLPANNMEWVEILVSRHFGERDPEAVILSEESKSKLALTNSIGQQYRATATHSSYMRPLCRTVKSLGSSLGNDKAEQVMLTVLHIPFLHFETHNGYKRMADFLKDEKERALRNSQPQTIKAPSHAPKKRSKSRVTRSPQQKDETKPVDPESVDSVSSEPNSMSGDVVEEPSRFRHILHGGGALLSSFLNFGDKVRQRSSQVAKMLRLSPGHQEDLEKGRTTASIQDDKKGTDDGANKPTQTSHEEKKEPQTIAVDKSGEPSGSILPKEVPKPGFKLKENNTENPPLTNVGVTGRDTEHSVNIEILQPPLIDIPRMNTGSSLDMENVHIPTTSVRRDTGNSVNLENLLSSHPTVRRRNTDNSLAESTNSMAQKSQDIPTHKVHWGKAKDILDTPTATNSSANHGRIPRRADGQRIEEIRMASRINTSDTNRGNLVDIIEEGSTATEPRGGATNITVKQDTKPEHTKRRIPFDEHLVKGYLLPSNPTDSSLQLRRTLDQYFYTHLSTTAARDSSQVVFRYTERNSPEPKIFMVDQLWLWILNDDTVISCFPQRWDVWSAQQPPIIEDETVPPVDLKGPEPPPPAPVASHEPFSHGKWKDKSKNESGRVLGWMAGKKAKAGNIRKDSQIRTQKWRESLVVEEPWYRYAGSGSSRSSTIERRRLALLKRDPLNVHQMILSHIGLKARDPLTTAHDLAHLITEFCIGLFDQYRVPDEYQFFDFFERSIGAVIDKETQCFEAFATRLAKTSSGSIASSEVFSISNETKLLVEVKDIIDELGILHMILSDQAKPAEDFSKLFAEHKKIKNGSINDENSSSIRYPVLENHLYRVEKMQKLANQTYKALYNLLDLKQKQNNVSEALSARKQAETASDQAKATTELTERGLENANLARKQADETIRQGRTVLVFTVVTIIFLPLSFMAAFFAINLDAFPWNKGDKLPMDYVLRYMFSISGAISIPFILIALNQDRIARFLKAYGKPTATGVSIIVLMVILLSVIWTRDTAQGMKAAVTVFIFLLALISFAVRGIYRLFSKKAFRITRDSDSPSSW